MAAVINPQKDHAVTSLAAIYSLKEINERTGLDITRKEYLKIFKHYPNLRTKTETKATFKRMAKKSYKSFVEAKQNYCLAKYQHGVLDD